MQIFKPKRIKTQRKKKKNKRKMATPEATQCPLCLKESSTMKLYKVCPCHLDDGAYKEMSLNGKTYRLVDGSKLAPYRERFLQAVEKKPKLEPEEKVLLRRIRIQSIKVDKKPISRKTKQDFYNSQEWRAVRFDVLREQGARCALCGATKETSIMHVDHITPLSKDWSLRLNKRNLQVLCLECNLGKSNRDNTDFRQQNNADKIDHKQAIT